MSNLSLSANIPGGGNSEKRYGAGEVIYAQGDGINSLNIVLSGKVRLLHEKNGRFQIIDIKTAKDFLDDTDLFSDRKRLYSAVAFTDSEIINVPKTEMIKIVKRCPDWVDVIMRTLSERLIQSVEMMREHKIIDESQFGGTITPSEGKSIEEAIQQFKSRAKK